MLLEIWNFWGCSRTLWRCREKPPYFKSSTEFACWSMLIIVPHNHYLLTV